MLMPPVNATAAVDDEQLAVVACVDVERVLILHGIRRVELAHDDAGRLEAHPKLAVGAAAADAVVDDAHRHALARFRGERFRELGAHLVVGENVGLEMDVMLGGRNRVAHRVVRLRAVEQQLDGVVAIERRVGQALDDLVEHAHGFRYRAAPRRLGARRTVGASSRRPSAACAPAHSGHSAASASHGITPLYWFCRADVAAPTPPNIKQSDRAKAMTMLRVGTYNVHGHKGTDGKVVADRTFDVVRRLHADCVALQEFVNAPAPTGESLLEHWARTLGMHGAYAPAFERGGEEFGNALLTRWPILEQHAHDVSLRGYRRRVVLEALVHVDGVTLQVMSLHLGVSPRERALQAQQLLRAVQRDTRRFPSLARRLQRMESVQRGVAPAARVLRRHAPVGDVSVAGARRRSRSRLGAPSWPLARGARGCVAGRTPRVGSSAARRDDRLLVTRAGLGSSRPCCDPSAMKSCVCAILVRLPHRSGAGRKTPFI